jgi:hypothetical protein
MPWQPSWVATTPSSAPTPTGWAGTRTPDPAAPPSFVAPGLTTDRRGLRFNERCRMVPDCRRTPRRAYDDRLLGQALKTPETAGQQRGAVVSAPLGARRLGGVAGCGGRSPSGAHWCGASAVHRRCRLRAHLVSWMILRRLQLNARQLRIGRGLWPSLLDRPAVALGPE